MSKQLPLRWWFWYCRWTESSNDLECQDDTLYFLFQRTPRLMNSILDELNPLESWILKGKISHFVVYPAEMQVKNPCKNQPFRKIHNIYNSQPATFSPWRSGPRLALSMLSATSPWRTKLDFRPEAKVSQSNWSFQEMARSFLLERSYS